VHGPPVSNRRAIDETVRGETRMQLLLRFVLILLALAAGASAADAQSVSHYKAVLIAGDWSAAAFDHATAAMQERLLARQVAPPGDVQRLSAARNVAGRNGVQSSTLGHVLAAIERMHPGPGEGCFVFATSHGGYDEGLVLVPSQDFLTPEALDHALDVGCGNAPTVAIISACFSGSFAKPPMARSNRVILTAARDDRTSFGCGAGFQYTVYDRCLLQALDHSAAWQAAYRMIKSCVAAREKAFRIEASDPQAAFGDAVASLPVPGAP
jgi:Peptidase C13 family